MSLGSNMGLAHVTFDETAFETIMNLNGDAGVDNRPLRDLKNSSKTVACKHPMMLGGAVFKCNQWYNPRQVRSRV